VTIKGNRAERLGAIGRTEGIACFATALLVRDEASKSSHGDSGADREMDTP
jgi:2-C-methyl-D-erythritol 2,4-cyclodiphosphate synthase